MYIIDEIKAFLENNYPKPFAKFRLRQIEEALFNFDNTGFSQISVLPLDIRNLLDANFAWLSLSEIRMFASKNADTYKVLLKTEDKQLIESVLMKNKRGQWTICVSSQIGCAMGCTFCATGKMGLVRNLKAHEIYDQYRFWQLWLNKQMQDSKDLSTRVSNMVFMGMGEPLANYDNVKLAINKLLEYTDLGPTKITVSSVGVLTNLNRLLTDKDWPAVRIAISLHSPEAIARKKIVPTTIPGFHEKLITWSQDYAKAFRSRSHHVTYEYTLISQVNDSAESAHELAGFIAKTAISKVNLIPLNPVVGTGFATPDPLRIKKFKDVLRSYNIDVTQRKTMGDDINAACGQLVASN